MRHGILALMMAGVLATQAQSQVILPVNVGGYGGFGGFGGYGYGFGGPYGGYGGYGLGGYGYGGYGGYGGFGFGSRFGYGGYPGLNGVGFMPQTFVTTPIVVTSYTRGITNTPVLPACSPLACNPSYAALANRYGVRLQTTPRMRTSLVPAEPVTSRVSDCASIDVIVPHGDAKVCFNGASMSQTGPVRSFVTPPLAAHGDYAFQVQCEDGGQTLLRTAQVRAGGHAVVDFTK